MIGNDSVLEVAGEEVEEVKVWTSCAFFGALFFHLFFFWFPLLPYTLCEAVEHAHWRRNRWVDYSQGGR